MKDQWWVYVVVGLLSISAGIAIAGLPDNAPVAATISSASTSEVPDSTVPETTETSPQTTSAPTSTPATTTSTPATTTSTPATTMPASTMPASTVPESTSPGTSAPDTGDSVPDGLPARSELSVAAANGANAGGAASRAAARLEEIGYVDVLPLNGTEFFEFTSIYYVDGLVDAALRLAADLDLLADFVAPIEFMPPVIDLPVDIELVAYIGLDRA